ncbi:MAG: lipoate--protein ligase [Clostridia bacterium]|nr:lipoate--protein ligase [Clostridia bacterium]
MIFVDTGSRDAAFNFGAEYYFAAERDLLAPVFMLWSTAPTLMIGKYQNVFEEVDLAFAREKGIKITRRLSGGGTIYTDEGGFQYTFIEKGGELIDFSEYMRPVAEALRRMGVPAEISGRNDMLLDGKKISGNAQFKLGGKTVHHGSLLFDTDLDMMERASRPPEYKITSKSIKSVRDRVTNIKKAAGLDMTAERFADELVRRIAEVSGGMERYELTAEDRKRIEELADAHFRDRDSVFLHSPAFDVEKVCHLPGGTVKLLFSVKNGVIKDVAAQGDFFSGDGTDALRALIGTPFEKDAVCAKIKNSSLSIWGVDNAALAQEVTKDM